MSRRFTILYLATLVLLTPALTATLHADPGKGKPKNAQMAKRDQHETESGPQVTISAGISIGDARQLASTYRLAGGKPLPPGIRKNLARGKPMPPGIRKTRLPDDFVTRLPHHEGYEWRRAGTDLVLVVSGSLVISDILKDVFD